MKNRYSIVIPTYNGERFIASAIESALAQTKSADEIIVSDDNSSDNTIEIAKQYEKDGIRIVVNQNGPSGFVKGWNNAIRLATCDYVSVLHQDDILYPDFLMEIDALLQRFPDVGHAFVPCDYVNYKGMLLKHAYNQSGEDREYSLHEYISAYLDCGNGTHIHRCPGVVTKRDLFDICTYREEAGHIADDDFFYRIGQYTKVAGVLKPLCAYREHSNSETGKLKDINLVSRLVRDYHFQLTNCESRCVFISSEKEAIKKLYHRYAKRLLAYSFFSCNVKSIIYSLYHLFLSRVIRCK